MVYNKKGEIFVHRLINICVGDYVLANEKSDYSGLVGVVREIRTDEDKETDNETVDIYVDFQRPLQKQMITEIEERFYKLSGEMKSFEEIALDQVIMAPEMLQSLSKVCDELYTDKLFAVTEKWDLDGEVDFNFTLFTDEKSAKEYMLLTIPQFLKEHELYEEDGESSFDDNCYVYSFETMDSQYYYEILVNPYEVFKPGGGLDE